VRQPGDWLEDPEARAWARRVLDELLPKIRGSKLTVSLIPDAGGLDDVKFAVELGLSIMLDKPIILAVPSGRQIPDRLVRVADEIVELGGIADPDSPERLRAAIDRVLGDPS